MKTFGIIGFGRFGKLAAKHLREHFSVFVADIVDSTGEAKILGVKSVSLEKCAGCDIVMLSVPISDFEETLIKISPHITKCALVLDVCSVKQEPVELMKKLLPSCDCIGTHPLFGPDSVKEGLQGNKIVLCPVRDTKLENVKRFLEGLGLEVIVTSAEEHDRQMAKSLALIHLLGRSLINIEADKVKLATPTHALLMELVNITRNDSEQLFQDMQIHNRFTAKARKELIADLKRIDDELDKKAG